MSHVEEKARRREARVSGAAITHLPAERHARGDASAPLNAVPREQPAATGVPRAHQGADAHARLRGREGVRHAEAAAALQPAAPAR